MTAAELGDRPISAVELGAGPVIAVELGWRTRALILEHAAAEDPDEACGILVGRTTAHRVRVREALPCRNAAPEAERGRRFEIDPRTLIDVRRELRASEHGIVGFYHSHPAGPAAPSRTDLEYLRLWPETAWVIAGVGPGRRPVLRAWWLDAEGGGAVRELRIESPRAAAPRPLAQLAGRA